MSLSQRVVSDLPDEKGELLLAAYNRNYRAEMVALKGSRATQFDHLTGCDDVVPLSNDGTLFGRIIVKHLEDGEDCGCALIASLEDFESIYPRSDYLHIWGKVILKKENAKTPVFLDHRNVTKIITLSDTHFATLSGTEIKIWSTASLVLLNTVPFPERFEYHADCMVSPQGFLFGISKVHAISRKESYYRLWMVNVQNTIVFCVLPKENDGYHLYVTNDDIYLNSKQIVYTIYVGTTIKLQARTFSFPTGFNIVRICELSYDNFVVTRSTNNSGTTAMTIWHGTSPFQTTDMRYHSIYPDCEYFRFYVWPNMLVRYTQQGGPLLSKKLINPYFNSSVNFTNIRDVTFNYSIHYCEDTSVDDSKLWLHHDIQFQYSKFQQINNEVGAELDNCFKASINKNPSLFHLPNPIIEMIKQYCISRNPSGFFFRPVYAFSPPLKLGSYFRDKMWDAFDFLLTKSKDNNYRLQLNALIYFEKITKKYPEMSLKEAIEMTQRTHAAVLKEWTWTWKNPVKDLFNAILAFLNDHPEQEPKSRSALEMGKSQK